MERIGRLRRRTDMPRVLIRFAALAVLTSCTASSRSDGTPPAPIPASTIRTADASTTSSSSPANLHEADLAAAQKRWTAATLSNYQFEATTTYCECAWAGILRLTATNGVITLVESRQPDGTYLARHVPAFPMTVVDLFEFVSGSIERGDLNAVRYDPYIGYPTYIDAGPTTLVDARVVVQIDSFSQGSLAGPRRMH